MEKKQHSKQNRWIVLIVVGAIVLAIGVYLFFDLPIYPDFSKEVASTAKAQSKLCDDPETKDVVVIDPSELGLEINKVKLLLQGRSRCSDPRGYVIECRGPVGEAQSVSVTVSAETQKESFDGELYRGMPTYTHTGTTFVHNVDFNLYMEGVLYQFCASYPFDGMTQAEIDTEDEELTELFHRAADLVLDANS